MKSSQRLDFSSLAEALGQKGLVDAQNLSLALQRAQSTGCPFPEVLVSDNLISDWELSRVVCDLYGLAFLPVDVVSPDPRALEGLDPAFLRKHRLVPVSRFGTLLTVAMPAITPAEVLGMLASELELHIQPVVGTVHTNNRWIQESLNTAGEAAVNESNWGNIFDEGDAAVRDELERDGDEIAELDPSLLEGEGLEFEVSDPDALSPGHPDPSGTPAALPSPSADRSRQEDPSERAGSRLRHGRGPEPLEDLPPPPSF